MKVFNFFTHIFTLFAFLTLGSLLIIFGIHVLSMDEILIRIREVYDSPWKSIQTIMAGLVFIAVGLSFARTMIKKGKADAIILQSELGPIVISVHAMEDITRKVLKRFHLVKESKILSSIRNKDIEIKIKLILWSGGKIQELLMEIQEETRARLKKLVGKESRIEVACDVQRIEDHEVESEIFEQEHAAL
ncbi:MAG: hypothetical protein EXS63_07065 [Candidatus Omnitrophica bacterium]|nr:hypothetical protein [Candidatus Omnitrophota bacterium]